MIDIQNSQDTREIPLQKVGIKDLKYPVRVLDKINKFQQTTANVNLFVNLPHNYKGTHMSRFIEIFHKNRNELGMKNFLAMLEEIRKSLDAQKAYGSITFPFFMTKKAPVSGSESIMNYVCTYEGEVAAEKSSKSEESEKSAELAKSEKSEIKQKFFVKIQIPITTLCPCSKAISKYGAHNQRGIVSVKLQNKSFFWIEDVIELVENCASSGLYSILKRPDEKFVTEHAYENPRFVEDIVREVYMALKNFNKSEKPFTSFSVECENFESIHNHNAYAFAEYNEI